MDLNELLFFVRVVEAGSFARAARALGTSNSTLSRKIADLESRLGVRLLQRTTRTLSLTNAGRIYYENAARIVIDIEEAERAVIELQAAPRGLLRITAPVGLNFLGRMVSTFLQRYPKIELSMTCTDRVVDLVDEGFDLAIRAGNLPDSSLVAKLLAHERWLLLASPAYLEKQGTPKEPSDLEDHACIVFSGGRSGQASWRLERGDVSYHARPEAKLMANDIDIVKEAALDGLGVAMLPASRVVEDIRLGRLSRVLTDWQAPKAPISIVYPSSLHLAPKVRAFVDHMSEQMTPPPWELGPGV